jgi:transposase
VPEVRRLLLALAERGERRAHRLRWSVWRRAHQALANRCHATRRALERARRLAGPAPGRTAPVQVELTDGEWARLRPLLPPQRPRVGRPRHDHRTVLGGILWVVRNRASWRDMPERFGKWERAYRRYRLWSDTGLWERLLRALRNAADEEPTEVLL